jgi:hypothetical protein
MSWQAPKTDWDSSQQGVSGNDFNRIEGNSLYLYNNLTWVPVESNYYIHISANPNLIGGDAVPASECVPIKKYVKGFDTNDNAGAPVDVPLQATRFVLPASLDITAGFSSNITAGDKIYLYIVNESYLVTGETNYFREGQAVQMFIEDTINPEGPGERKKGYPAFITKSWDISAPINAWAAEITGKFAGVSVDNGIIYYQSESYTAVDENYITVIQPNVFEFNHAVLGY